MLTIIAIALLTLAALSCIFLASFVRLWKTPPAVHIDVNIPDEFKLVLQKLPATIETNKPTEAPIPGEILEYISLESDMWAQDARKKRARALYADAQNWSIVLRQLQLEDSTLERP